MKIVSDAAKFYEDDRCVGVGVTFDQMVQEGLAEEVTFELITEG